MLVAIAVRGPLIEFARAARRLLASVAIIGVSVGSPVFGQTAIQCQGLSWFSNGLTYGPFTYYPGGTHTFPAQANFVISGWSEQVTANTHIVYYPYRGNAPYLSTNGAAEIVDPDIKVSCWDSDTTPAYDYAQEEALSGYVYAYFDIGEDCNDSSCTHEGSDPNGGDVYCTYLVKADENGLPIVDGNGNYEVIEELGCS